MTLMSEEEALDIWAAPMGDDELPVGAHAVAREQHRRDVERVRALIAEGEEALERMRVHDPDESYWECAVAQLDGMRAVLAALEATK